MRRKLYVYLLVLVTGSFTFHACDLVPDLSPTPTISHNELQRTVITDLLGNRIDSITISINFRDGDGDLGLNTGETSPPYQQYNADGSQNPFFYNYFLDIYKKVNGEFQQVQFTPATFNLNGRFPRLAEGERPGPIEGVLHYGITLVPTADTRNPDWNPDIGPGDTIRFSVQIADRALQLSNRIETTEIVVLTRE
jgi:hypothetical protein